MSELFEEQARQRCRRRHPRLTITFAAVAAGGRLWCVHHSPAIQICPLRGSNAGRRRAGNAPCWRWSTTPIHDVSAVNF